MKSFVTVGSIYIIVLISKIRKGFCNTLYYYSTEQLVISTTYRVNKKL